MKHLYLIAMGVVLSQGAFAAQPAERFAVDKGFPVLSSSFVPEHAMTFSTPAQAQKSAEEKFKVTVTFGLDGEDIEPAVINFYDSEGNVTGCRPMGETASINLPAGRYDALCLFESNSPKSRFPLHSTIWVVKEGIEINGEAEVNFDAAEVKEPIKVRPVHADGSAVQIDKTTQDADRNWYVVEKGNCAVVLHRVVLFADGNRVMMSGGGSYTDHAIKGDYTKTENDPEPAFDIWINPLSDRFKMACMRMLINDDCVEIIGLPVGKLEPKTLTNDPSNYNEFKASFVHTPAYELRTEEYLFPYGITAEVSLGDSNGYMLAAKTANNAAHKVKICVDEPNDEFTYGASFELADRIDIRHIAEEIFPGFVYEYDEDYTSFISSPTGRYSDGKLIYEVSLNTYHTDGDGHPIAPDHSYQSSNMLMSFGEGVPFTEFEFGSTSRDGVVNPLIRTYSVGLCGEVRRSDNADVAMSILVDGKQALSNEINTLDKWQKTIDIAKNAPSTIQVDAWHDNAVVDDIKGSTKMTAVMNFADGADSDYFPPILTSLQMRAPGGFISQAFGKAEHGEISLYAGDFNQVFGREMPNGALDRYFEYADIEDIKIEYAQHGSEEFKSIPVTVTEDEADADYGKHYLASLATVSGDNNSWYDLRISLKDKADNTQVQTISPAFYLFSTSGISTVNKDNSAAYAVIGRTIVSDCDDFSVYGINGVKVSPYNLAPGIYVVKAGSTVDKVSIK